MKIAKLSMVDKETGIVYHLAYISQEELELLDKIIDKERRGLLEY